MKTKSILLIIATVAFSSYSFSQELSENFLNDIPDTQNEYVVDNSAKHGSANRRAVFNTTSNYGSLQDFINLNIEFPEEARIIGVTGAVVAHFEILKDGSLGEIFFVQSPDLLFSNEVERVLRLAPRFIPAIKHGSIVQSYEKVKINFNLH